MVKSPQLMRGAFGPDLHRDCSEVRVNTPSVRLRWATPALGSFLLSVLAIAPASAQSPCTTPATERTAEVGCYFTAAESLGVLPPHQIFWHLYSYPSSTAAERAQQSRGVVVEVFDKVWLYTIASADWRPTAGARVAVVGPLPTMAGTPYIARYMEAVFLPGMRTRVHRHSGPEAWYVLTGAQCLETPEGIILARAGESAVVRAGPPMVLSSVGQRMRRAVLLVLHDASQPWTAMEEAWRPRGACPP
jgi:quercetin dioxygenase-like cupin family protein